MRRVLLVLGLQCGVVLAAPPRELAGERTAFLGGRVSLRLPDGMIAAGEDGAALDWDGERFTVTVTERAGVTEGELQHQITARVARVEKIAISRPWTAYVVAPRAPRRSDGRAEVLAVYARDPRGTLIVVAFAIDDAGFDEAGRWAALARRSADTLSTTSPLPSPPPPAQITGTPVRIGSGPQYCDVEDNVLDLRAASDRPPEQAVTGKLHGQEVYWFLWADRRAVYAEAITGGTRWGQLHVVCQAPDRKQLDAIRALVERRLSG